MKESQIGYVINLDKIFRIVIPVAVRKKLNIKPDDKLELYCENDKIILQVKNDRCLFCGSKNSLSDYQGKKICISCLSDIKNT